MAYDVEHLFIWLFAICISSLVRYLLRSLVHLLIGLFVYLLLSFKSSLYILDNSYLSDMSFANIFFGEVSVQIYGPFIIVLCAFLLSFKSFLFLDNSPLSDVSFADIFNSTHFPWTFCHRLKCHLHFGDCFYCFTNPATIISLLFIPCHLPL